MEAFDKIFVDPTFLTDDPHGLNIGCIYCHGGDNTTMNRDAAHEGMSADPAAKPEENCTPCHQKTVDTHMLTLHYDTHGEFNIISQRASTDEEALSALKTGYTNHCATCHASCGSCHVSRPTPAEGGFLKGHLFQKTPSIQNNCTACHGTRVGDEYLGRNEGYLPDTHWLANGSLCQDCHSMDEMHGNGREYFSRYENEPRPECTDCHDLKGDKNEFHSKHAEVNRGGSGFSGKSLTCQTCHSSAYKNCFNCHVGIDDQGLTYFKTDPSMILFKIGNNPLQSDRRPEDFSLLRHVPVARTTFEFYGDDILTNFDVAPTWKYTTPHNINRETCQNASCNSCHGHDELFLTTNDVDSNEQEANKYVVVDGAPGTVQE